MKKSKLFLSLISGFSLIPVVACLRSIDKGFETNHEQARADAIFRLWNNFNKARTVEEVKDNKSIIKITKEDLNKDGFVNASSETDPIGLIKLIEIQSDAIYAFSTIPTFAEKRIDEVNNLQSFMGITVISLENEKYDVYLASLDIQVNGVKKSFRVPNIKVEYRVLK